MEIISNEEYKKIECNLTSRGTRHEIISKLISMKSGEALIIKTDEWTRKTPFNTFLSHHKGTIPIILKKLNNGEGWVILKN